MLILYIKQSYNNEPHNEAVIKSFLQWLQFSETSAFQFVMFKTRFCKKGPTS